MRNTKLLTGAIAIAVGVAAPCAVAETVELKSGIVAGMQVDVDRAKLMRGMEYTFSLSNTCEVNRDAMRPGAAKHDGAVAILRVPKTGPVSYIEPRAYQFRNRSGLIINFRRDGVGYSYQVAEHHTKLGTWHATIQHLVEQNGVFLNTTPHATSSSLPPDVTVHDRRFVPGLGLALLRHVEETVGKTRVVGSAIDLVDPVSGELKWRWTSNVDAEFPGSDVAGTGIAKQYFHANSIVYHAGRSSFIVSARGMSTIYEVSYPDGRVRNRINCKSWTCLNDPYGGFTRQHDATLSDDGTMLTLFDNANQLGERTRPSRGVTYKISFENRTLDLVKAWPAEGQYPYRYLQGGYQPLDDGTAVLGWGAIDNRTCQEIGTTPQPPSDHLLTHRAADGSPIVTVRVPPGWSTYRTYGYPID